MNSILYEKEITLNAIDSAYEKGKKEGTIEELEQIKKNINKELVKGAGMTSYREGLLFALDSIDNEIKRLKE